MQRTIRRFPSPGAPDRRGADRCTRRPGAGAPAARRRRARRPTARRSSGRLARRRLPAGAPRRARGTPAASTSASSCFSEETDWCCRIRRAGWDIRHLPLHDGSCTHTGRSARPDLFAQNSHSSSCTRASTSAGGRSRAVSRGDRAAPCTAARAGRAGRARAPGHAPACQRRAPGARWSSSAPRRRRFTRTAAEVRPRRPARSPARVQRRRRTRAARARASAATRSAWRRRRRRPRGGRAGRATRVSRK